MPDNRPIKFEFIADVADYLRDVKKMEVSTDDIAEALIGVTESSDDLERKLSRAMRDAAKDTDVLERAVKGIPKATDDAADQAVRDFDRLGDSARDAGSEVGDEFRQNLGESLSSGNMEDLVQDTLGGLVAGLKGPMGIAFAGIAGIAALAFGQIKAKWEETQAAIAAQTESMWTNSLAAARDGIGKVAIEISNTMLAQQELSRLWEEAPDDMVELVDHAKALNINASDLLLARAGDEAALGRVKVALDHVYDVQNATGEATVDQIKAVEGVEGALYKSEEALKRNNAQVDAYNDSLPAMANFHTIMAQESGVTADNIALWKVHADEAAAAFRLFPNDLNVRLRVDASELRQYFPYGVGGGGSKAALDYKLRHPEAAG